MDSQETLRPTKTTSDYVATDSSFRYEPPQTITTEAQSKASLSASPKSYTRSLVQEVTSAISLQATEVRLHPWRTLLRQVVKVGVTAFAVVVAIVCPGFENIMSFLGAFSCFVICVHGPILADFKLYGKNMSRRRVVINIVLLCISTGQLNLFAGRDSGS